jgi:DNA-binding LacI/PurR family transcriptional regulator
LRAGRDISIVGHDNISAATYTDPPLTTLELPIHGTGERLVEILLAVLGGARPRDFQEVWPVRLVERGSHGPAPATRLSRPKNETLESEIQGGSHARTSGLAP